MVGVWRRRRIRLSQHALIITVLMYRPCRSSGYLSSCQSKTSRFLAAFGPEYAQSHLCTVMQGRKKEGEYMSEMHKDLTHLRISILRPLMLKTHDHMCVS